MAVRAAMGRHDLHKARLWLDRTLVHRGWRPKDIVADASRSRSRQRFAVVDRGVRSNHSAFVRRTMEHQGILSTYRNISRPSVGDRWQPARRWRYGLSRRQRAGWTLAALGAWLFRRGATGHCHTYDLLGFSTADRDRDTRRALGGAGARSSRKASRSTGPSKRSTPSGAISRTCRGS
jgi:hypothetical protein